MPTPRPISPLQGFISALFLFLSVFVFVLVGSFSAQAATGVHTTYLWHMHQPIYWPDASTWTPGRYEMAYETITLGHGKNNVFDIFNKDDRVADYQWYPRDAVSSVLDLPDAGAQVSFAGSLMENIFSLGDNSWNGSRYASDWFAPYRQAMNWTTSTGERRLDPVLVGFHHAIGPLLDENALTMELACAREIWSRAWGSGAISQGFFPAEMCFSERMIPALVGAGIQWSIVPDLHLGRACVGYPYQANLDNCDPPNPADQINPSQGNWTNHTISRGVTLKVPYPFGFTPHRAQWIDPDDGTTTSLVVVPAANAMGWEEGYGLFGTGGVDALAAANDPARPMLVLFAHDGDNSWSGGYSYYNENVTQFAHNAAAKGYTPTTIATYLDQHPVPADDVVHVEDGGWVNADGDFGSPQYINWNWPLVDAGGQFDIPGGWAEDERNWAVLTAAQNRVETAAQITGVVDPARVVDPLGGANDAERAWHFLLAGYESGYMYYGTSLDMEIKATLACNQATDLADGILGSGPDDTPPTVWLPQRLPWNPGGFGGGAMWGWPSGDGTAMTSAFKVWTFAHDVSGLARVELMVRQDTDGWNDPATPVNETYAGGVGVAPWLALPMNYRAMPLGEPWDMPGVDFTVLPQHIADEYWLELSGYSDVLLDYYIEAEDNLGNIKRTPIQHVYVGTGDTGGGTTDQPFVMDGTADAQVPVIASGDMNLMAQVQGHWLYLASDAPTAHPNEDVFLMLDASPSGATSAPWAKSGQVVPWLRFLARESDNGWTGWFDETETLLELPGLVIGSGVVLEGALDLDQLFPGGWPAAVQAAVVTYATADGGSLLHQSPGGNLNGDLDFLELVEIPLAASAVPARDQTTQLRVWPNPFNANVNLALTGAPGSARLRIFDARGRLIRGWSLEVSTSTPVQVTWDGRDNHGRVLPSGVYFVRAETVGSTSIQRVSLVK